MTVRMLDRTRLALIAMLVVVGNAAWAQQLGRLKVYPAGLPKADSVLTCHNGEAIKGVVCTTEDCDKKKIVCQAYTGAVDSTARYSWAALGSNDRLELAGFAAGIDDHDNRIRVRSLTTDLLKKSDDCYWIEPDSGQIERMCEQEHLVSGVSCDGEFCADLDLRCCRAVFVQAESADQAGNPTEGESSK